MTIIEFLQVLHDSQIGTDLRESLYMFPLVEGIHLIGLAVSIGLLFLADLRLVGLIFTKVPVQNVLKPLRIWILSGFLVTFATGVLLIWAEGPRIYQIPVFPLKLVFILIAGINAAWFELKYGRAVELWGKLEKPPKPVAYAGYISLASWTVVVICGRLIPYLDALH